MLFLLLGGKVVGKNRKPANLKLLAVSALDRKLTFNCVAWGSNRLKYSWNGPRHEPQLKADTYNSQTPERARAKISHKPDNA